MLKARVVTAVVLLVLFLSALYVAAPFGWVSFVTLIATVAAWEWAGLMRLGLWAKGVCCAAMGGVCLALCFLFPSALGISPGFPQSAWQFGRWVYVPACLFWFLLVPFWLKHRWPLSPAVGFCAGVVVILPTWAALVQLRQAGPLALIGVMAIIWLADTGAYFVGRRFGRRKLALSISPGKSWEGAIGGAVTAIVYGLTVVGLIPAISMLQRSVYVLAVVVTVVFSVIGDLYESLLKRQANLKDSGGILPGHGGVLDRIDSLTSTLPFVATVWLVTLNG